MTNIALFIVSVVGYFAVWCLFTWDVKVKAKECAKRLGILALLCLPINVGGNVFTVMGNAVAEKSVYSIFSAYQDAHDNAFELIFITYQKAGGDAINGIGLGV